MFNLSLTAACVAVGVLSVFVLHVSTPQLHSRHAQYKSRYALCPAVLSCVLYADALIIVDFQVTSDFGLLCSDVCVTR